MPLSQQDADPSASQQGSTDCSTQVRPTRLRLLILLLPPSLRSRLLCPTHLGRALPRRMDWESTWLDCSLPSSEPTVKALKRIRSHAISACVAQSSGSAGSSGSSTATVSDGDGSDASVSLSSDQRSVTVPAPTPAPTPGPTPASPVRLAPLLGVCARLFLLPSQPHIQPICRWLVQAPPAALPELKCTVSHQLHFGCAVP